MTEAQFVEDRRTQRAVERSFEIIGEALSRLVRDFPAVAEHIPEHRRVIDFRNVLAHGYDVVDPRLVYGLARTRLPALLAAPFRGKWGVSCCARYSGVGSLPILPVARPK